MRKQNTFFVFFLFCLCSTAQTKTYYINHIGNDANNGLSEATAWQTLTPINNINLGPGDQVLLEGGQVFTGSIQFNANDFGTAINPIKISSYGNGIATIYSINATALYSENAGAIHISRLIFKGDGSNHDGIDFMINQTTTNIDHIYIDSIEVSGFGGRGFLLGAYSTDKGFNDVNIQHSNFHDNGVAGLETFGAWPSFSNTHFYIGYCKFYNNPGVLTSTQTTGTGLVVSGVDSAVVEYCEAYNNGANNRSPGGGPVGIWAYDAKHVVIQYCESHHNKAGLLKDGGGFDLDGGSQYCIVQYCYSHDNEGYGFALVEYGSSNEFTGNIIRYNISQNDGRKNSYGAFCCYAVDASHPVKNSEIYNNTAYVDASNLTNGRPSAVSIQSQNFSGVSIRNNIFYVTGGVDIINSLYALSSTEIYFRSNSYFSTANVYDFWWNGMHYTSLDNWKSAASGQEVDGSASLGILQNPLLEGAGSGGTISPADGGNFNSLFGYSLNPFSPLVQKAIKIGDVGMHDFFGTTLPSSSNYDIGAAEAIDTYPLPLSIISFSGASTGNHISLQWKVANEEYLEKYEIQKSLNGADFISIGYLPPSNKTFYGFNDKNIESATVYYRLKYVYSNGRYGLSNSIQISSSIPKQSLAFYREGNGMEIHVYSNRDSKADIFAYASGGSLVHASSYDLQKGYNSIVIRDAVKWERGIYFIQIASDHSETAKCIR